MKLACTEHTSRPWRIHELTRDFRLEDVWALRAPGHPDDFARLVAALAGGDPADSASPIVRGLFALRWKLGEWLGWDQPSTGVGRRVGSLRARLPEDLRRHPGPEFTGTPFTALYLLEDEFAAEMGNQTVHGVLHLGWLPQQQRAQMAVLVKPNGLFGSAYMAAIKPFRYLAVYPVMLRELEQQWAAA